MSDEKKQTFVVNDRRKFNLEGEQVAPSAPEAEKPKSPAPPAQQAAPQPVKDAPPPEQEIPPPSHAEQKEQADRYSARSKDLDDRLQGELDARGTGRKARDFEMTFDKFIGSLYMTALMQLGLMQPEGGQPHADLIGARQTIDTLGILAEKTKGNLTPQEETLLTTCMYELRMAYVELTNAITHPPAGVVPPGPGVK